MEKHPYTSSVGQLRQLITHLRDVFPETVDAKTLQKLGIAPNNESYIVNILRFIGVIDAGGNRTEEGQNVFSQHDDEDFNKDFSSLIRKAYSALFDLHSDSAWKLDEGKLTTFFRSQDKTSKKVGIYQARTFRTLSGLSGNVELVDRKPSAERAAKRPAAKKAEGKGARIEKRMDNSQSKPPVGKRDVGLTVRIEVNLPAQGDQETYDRIFKSIRKYLINAE
jgi:hypothetical protein